MISEGVARNLIIGKMSVENTCPKKILKLISQKRSIKGQEGALSYT